MAKFGKDPIYRTKVIVQKPLWTPAIPNHIIPPVSRQAYKKGFFTVKWDMRSGYHHLNIHSEHNKFLGFSWNIDGKDKYFIFSVLPFGLYSTGHIFIKVVRVLVNYWRSQCWACDSYERCARMAKIVHQDLLDAGFLPNNEKSIPYLHLHKS